MKRERPTAWIALVAGTLGIGFASIFAKLALASDEVGSTAIAFWRTGLAAVVLGTALAVRVRWIRGRVRSRRSAEPSAQTAIRAPLSRAWLAVPGVLFALDLATWHHAFRYTTAAHATLLANLQVVLVGLYGWAVLKESMPARFVAGAAVALFGVAALLGIEGAGATLRGNLWAVGTAFFYASYLIAIRFVRGSFSTLTVMAGSSSAAAAGALAISIGLGENLWPKSVATWSYVGGLALVSHVGGQGLIAWSLARVPVSLAGVTLLLQPVFAAVLGALILDEHISLGQVAAGVVVLFGLELARRTARTPRPPSAPPPEPAEPTS